MLHSEDRLIPSDALKPALSYKGYSDEPLFKLPAIAEEEEEKPTADCERRGCRTEMNRLALGLGFTLVVEMGLQARVIMVRVGIALTWVGRAGAV